jgi:nucleoside-diphosphate-sugar epimerase
MRLLVTGSNGFIGGRIAALAAERGWEVTGLGRATAAATPVTDYVRHDLSSPLALAKRVDAVVHCAALAVPWARPSAFVSANVLGTRHVVDWCRDNSRPYLVQVSSSSVLYRNCDQFGLTEESPVTPDARQLNAYSRSKRAGERVAEGYQGRWAVVRPRAVFGPGDTTLLPRILAAARRGLMPVLEGSRGRRVVCDLTYVDTVAHYVITAVEREVEGTYNLTNGQHVELYPFLLDVLARLGYMPRFPRVPVGAATALAGAAEVFSAAVLGYREPPLTRFGVSMLAYSRTFDAAKCQRDLGPPAVSLAEGVERLIAAHALPAAGTGGTTRGGGASEDTARGRG